MNTTYDTILWLQSQATSKRFPIVQFSGDTDMVTQGWVSLTSIERPEIVVTRLDGRTIGYLLVADRNNDRIILLSPDKRYGRMSGWHLEIVVPAVWAPPSTL